MSGGQQEAAKFERVFGSLAAIQAHTEEVTVELWDPVFGLATLAPLTRVLDAALRPVGLRVKLEVLDQ